MKQRTTETNVTANMHVRDLIDEICDSFESEWMEGKRPDLAAYLKEPGVPSSHQSSLAQELVALDIEYREAQRETPQANDYLSCLDTKYRAAIRQLFPSPASSDTVCIDTDLSIAQFTAHLASSGLVDDEQLARHRREKGPESPANQLAQDLVDAGVLTPYQANLVAAGDAKQLVFGQYTILDELGRGGVGAFLP